MFGNQDHIRPDNLGGVACSVTTCSYHGKGNTCQAAAIKVGTEYAADKSETFCTTYQHRPDAF